LRADGKNGGPTQNELQQNVNLAGVQRGQYH
jgi:hypothetical protein